MAYLQRNKPKLNLKGLSHCYCSHVHEELIECYLEFDINKGHVRCRICPAGPSSSILVANLSKHLKTAGHLKQQAIIAKRSVPPPASSASAPSCSAQDDAMPQGESQMFIAHHLYLPSSQMMDHCIRLVHRRRIPLHPLQGLGKTTVVVLTSCPRLTTALERIAIP